VPDSDHAFLAGGLQKRYGETPALAELDLSVPYGTVYGLLGPNGAGKTAAVRILTTLTRLEGGRARVAGHDVVSQPRQVRRRIGLTGRQTAVDDAITARQNLVMFGRLFHIGQAAARRRADELLAQFGLAAAAGKPPKQFSGGMRRRLDLASSMILAPRVLFLDEPTTGLDPAGRREVWQAVRDLAKQGTTVLLTTHYLDEADKLCDRIRSGRPWPQRGGGHAGRPQNGGSATNGSRSSPPSRTIWPPSPSWRTGWPATARSPLWMVLGWRSAWPLPTA
jgi:ABC-2 type transport system ATP-binding protein